MTILQRFVCGACGLERGPFGTHGFDPERGEGELFGVCKPCGLIGVTRVVSHQLTGRCWECGDWLERYASRCPKCDSDRCGFELDIPGLPRRPRPAP